MQNPTDAQTALAVARLCLMKMGKEPMERPSALYSHYAHELVNAFALLDDAGVFAKLDEEKDYASAEEVLAESAAQSVAKSLGVLDPAEWGDTSALDMLRHQTAVSGLGKLERVPGTDTLRPVRETAAQAPGSDDEGSPTDVMFGSLKGTESLPFASCTCGRRAEASPALHAGTCPVWARHHNLTPVPRVHTHVWASPHTDEVCYGAEDCTMTYGQYRELRG
jgi:hypothetical protein